MSIIRKLFSRATSKSKPDAEHVADGSASLAVTEHFDPQSDTFIQDPYPVLRVLRQQAPLLRLRNGSWILSRHADIVAALADSRLGNSPSPFAVVNVRNSDKYSSASVANNILPFLDAPGHTELRQVIANVFLEQLTGDRLNLSAMVRARLEGLEGEPFDPVQEFASPLCVELMSRLFGLWPLKPGQVNQLKDWSSWFFYLFSIIPDEATLAKLNTELDEFRQFMGTHLGGQRDSSGDNLAARLMGLTEQFPAISEQQVVDNSLLLMADGVNADFGVANALLTLAQYPDQFDHLRQRPELCGSAAAELLRFESPSLFIARRALEDMEIGGQLIRKNSGVLLMLASANRDEQVFDHPDELDFSRRQNPYLTFGKGVHACMGRVLVLNLVKALCECLAERVERVELIPGALTWESRAGHRWPVASKIRLS